MRLFDLIILICISSLAIYAYFTRPIHVKHFILSGWAVVNLATITLGIRRIESVPNWIPLLVSLLSLGLLFILAIRVMRYLRATRNKVPSGDTWNPGVSPWFINVSVIVTTPLAYYLAMVSDKPILLPDIPSPYFYVAVLGFAILAVIAFLPGKWKDKLGTPTKK